MLEGTADTNPCNSTNLNLSKVKRYSLFPGQIVAVKGNNITANDLVVEEIYSSVPLPLPEQTPVVDAYEKRTCDEKWICNAYMEIKESSGSEESDDYCKKNPTKNLLKVMNRKFAELEKALTFNGEIMDELQNTIKLITDENKNLKKE
nr:unnamed protein product [Callosobruchus analis]